MKYSGIILAVFISFLLADAYGQSDGSGNVVIVQDASIDTILMTHQEVLQQVLKNDDNYAIDGYRIQIFEESGNKSSTLAREAMAEFSEKYPDIGVYLTWKAPNFKVRVGDFNTRMEAEGFLHKIKKDYPIAWVIKDKIKFPISN